MSNEFSKKVFFLYPHSVIKDQMIKEIMRNEYEVYFIFDHKKLFKLIKKYNDSIVFINIDEGLPEAEWESYIKKIQETKGLENIRMGILTYNNNPQLQQKYLMDLMISCGFIKLALGIQETTEILLKTLEVNEARGRRRFVRASCKSDQTSSFNIRFQDTTYKGTIADISSAGVACQLESSCPIRLRTYLSDIQLRLKGVICRVDGVVGAIREGDQPLYVIMFDQNSMKPEEREKVNLFVFKSLQDTINSELKGINVQY